MKISTDSWHYRLIDFLNWDHADNLCLYFWESVFAIFVATVALPLLAIASLFIVTLPLLHMFYSGYWLPGVIIVGMLEVIGLFMFLYVVVKDKPEPSLAWLWIKAKHDKVCPLLDFD